MPFSAEEGQDLMMSWIKEQNPGSMVDIGAGSGTYGRLMRAQNPLVYTAAVEVYRPYVHRFGLRKIYDQVLVTDARSIMPMFWPSADIVIMGDVLEHMSEKDAVRVWDLARKRAHKAVYLSVPIIHYPQGEVEGNPYEEHVVDDYSHERIMDTFPGITRSWTGTIVGRYEAVVR